MSSLLYRIYLAISVFRSPPDTVAVLWTPERSEGDNWTAVYSERMAESEDPREALERVFTAKARRDLRGKFRGGSDD